jgi:hypothetical protein
MAYKDLKTGATRICGPSAMIRELWYYEESAGIQIVCSSGLVGEISWRKIRAMLRRKDKKS